MGRKPVTPVELIIVLVVAGILIIAALPAYSRYAAAAAVSAARGDLKILHSYVEAYFTWNQDVPARPDGAIPGWSARYSGKYAYTRYGPHKYEFATREKIGGVYLFIDQRGTVEERN